MAEDLKGEYEESLTMRAPADRVFDFIADVRNLPKYLPTTKEVPSYDKRRAKPGRRARPRPGRGAGAQVTRTADKG